MPNDWSAVTPQLLAQGLMALRENSIMPRLVNLGYSKEAGERGSVVEVPIPSAVVVQEVSPANVPPTTLESAPTKVIIPMDQWWEAPFYLTDKDMITVMNGTIPMQASEAIKALCNKIDSQILSQYVELYGYVGTAGTTPFGNDTQDVTKALTTLNVQLAPVDDRRMVIDAIAQGNAMNLRPFQDASWGGNVETILNGRLTRRLGFDWFMDQNIPTHTAGTAAAATVTLISNSAAGVSVVTLKVASSTATLVKGDVLTFAGHTQTYTVTAAATLDTTGVVVSISPKLKIAVNGSSVAVATTVKASHVVNLAFHRDCIAFANRPLERPPQGLGSIVQSETDDVSGLSLRLEVTREYKRTRFSFDALWGSKVVRPELGVRIAG